MANIDLSYYERQIVEQLQGYLNRSGVFFRIFSRAKTPQSIKRKLELKKDKYSQDGCKMQDLIGIRIVFYFIDDVQIFADYLRHKDFYINESNSEQDLAKINVDSIDLLNTVFMPTRLNLICKIPENLWDSLHQQLAQANDFDPQLIDLTYEVQLRSVLSEGWHEVEHDLRYKCKDEPWWKYCKEDSRFLNGIFATLETSERSMKDLFSNIAYKNYKKKDWAAMLRNHFCLRFVDSALDDWVIDLFNKDEAVPKAFLRFDRKALISNLCKSPIPYPLKMMNIVYLVNRLKKISSVIKDHESSALEIILDKVLNLV